MDVMCAQVLYNVRTSQSHLTLQSTNIITSRETVKLRNRQK